MSNATTIDKAFKAFEKQMYKSVRMELNKWCWQIIEAAILARELNPNAHDFTGNLLNSIVVCLYENGEPYAPYFASDAGAAPALRPKMRKSPGLRRVIFRPDYSGKNSSYLPTVETNGGWGREDAEKFFASHRPQGNNMFDIVVAYTVEYADWVEIQRQTTGILQTREFARKTGITFMKLKAA